MTQLSGGIEHTSAPPGRPSGSMVALRAAIVVGLLVGIGQARAAPVEASVEELYGSLRAGEVDVVRVPQPSGLDGDGYTETVAFSWTEGRRSYVARDEVTWDEPKPGQPRASSVEHRLVERLANESGAARVTVDTATAVPPLPVSHWAGSARSLWAGSARSPRSSPSL